jgi:hypothetical protein
MSRGPVVVVVVLWPCHLLPQPCPSPIVVGMLFVVVDDEVIAVGLGVTCIHVTLSQLHV